MPKITINKQGFYPILKPVDEDTNITRLSNKSFNINMPKNCTATIYIGDRELGTTDENIIDLSDLPAEMLANAKIIVKVFKEVMGYVLPPVIKELRLELLACDENDEVLIYCSDTLLCS